MNSRENRKREIVDPRRKHLVKLLDSIERHIEEGNRKKGIEDLDEAEMALPGVVDSMDQNGGEALRARYWRLRADALRSEGEFGDLQKAQLCARKAISHAVLSGDQMEQAYAFYTEGLTCLYNKQFECALESAKKGLYVLMFSSIHENQLEIDFAMLQGRVFLERGFHQTALEDFTSLLDKVSDSRRRRDILNYMGTACRGLEKFYEALDWFQQAADIAEQIGSIVPHILIRKNIAVMLARLHQFEAAELAFDRCINAIEKIPDTTLRYRLLAKGYNDKGGLYLDHGDSPEKFQQARELFVASMTMLDKLKNMGHSVEHMEVFTRGNIGALHWREGKGEEAVRAYRELIERCRSLNLHGLEGRYLRRLGEVLISMEKFEEAESILKEVQSFVELPFDEGVMVELRLSELYEAKGEYNTALQHYKVYHQREQTLRDKRANEAATLGNLRFEVVSLRREVRRIVNASAKRSSMKNDKLLSLILDVIDPTFTRKLNEAIPRLTQGEYGTVLFMRYLGRADARVIAKLMYRDSAKANAVSKFQQRARKKGGFEDVSTFQTWINDQ